MLEHFDRIDTRLIGRATSTVFVPAGETFGTEIESVEISPGSDFFILALIDSHGLVAEERRSFELALRNPEGEALRPSDDEMQFVYGFRNTLALAVRHNPEPGIWQLEVSNPEALDLQIAILIQNRRDAGRGSRIPFRCRACILSAEALAVAIAFALGKAVIPAAIIAAVAKFLGVLAEVAEAFIHGLIGLSVKDVARKLCRYIGLCP
jgi:hypothetical protein